MVTLAYPWSMPQLVLWSSCLCPQGRNVPLHPPAAQIQRVPMMKFITLPDCLVAVAPRSNKSSCQSCLSLLVWMQSQSDGNSLPVWGWDYVLHVCLPVCGPDGSTSDELHVGQASDCRQLWSLAPSAGCFVTAFNIVVNPCNKFKQCFEIEVNLKTRDYSEEKKKYWNNKFNKKNPSFV